MFKKNFLGITSLALLVCLVGCTEYDGVFEGYSKEYLRKAGEYRLAFINDFGQINPNQSWGFGDMDVLEGGMSTRSSNTNHNLWANPNQMNLQVPGYPDSEGTFHTESGYVNGKKLEELVDNQMYNPVGDVTDEEIQYVSRWFREHPNPKSVKVHWTEFFVQSVSADADREIIDNKCNGECIDIIPIKEMNESTGKYEDWYEDGQLKTDKIEYFSDELKVLTFDGVAHPEDASSWDHIYDFNNGNSNFKPTEIEKTDYRTITLFTCSGTENFAYHSTYDNNWYDNYVIVPLVFDIPQSGEICKIHNKACTNHHYEGYYLAFDYETHKKDAAGKLTERNCDGFYSNWILKISPALRQTTETSSTNWRVMCEDLGAIGDYDFNDVVFDISYVSEGAGVDAVVTLQAAGGTLPVCLGEDDDLHEVHHLFGQEDTKTPINVGFKGIQCHVAIFRVKNVKTTNPNDILIMVHNGMSQEAVYSLQATTGEVPQKICVPAGAKWTLEGVNIKDAYPFFTKWVSDYANVEADAQNCYGWSSATVNPLGGRLVTEYDQTKVYAETGDSRQVNTITFQDKTYTQSAKMKVWHTFVNEDAITK